MCSGLGGSDIPDGLSDEHIAFLSELGIPQPVYLKHRSMKAFATCFIEESSLELHSFLSNELAKSLETHLPNLDVRDGQGPDRADGTWIPLGAEYSRSKDRRKRQADRERIGRRLNELGRDRGIQLPLAKSSDR